MHDSNALATGFALARAWKDSQAARRRVPGSRGPKPLSAVAIRLHSLLHPPVRRRSPCQSPCVPRPPEQRCPATRRHSSRKSGWRDGGELWQTPLNYLTPFSALVVQTLRIAPDDRADGSDTFVSRSEILVGVIPQQRPSDDADDTAGSDIQRSRWRRSRVVPSR
jgi:hypothetical protein